MEHIKHESTLCKESLNHTQGKVDMILGLILDNMTTDFSNQVMMDEQTENGLKMGKLQNATASILPIYPQEQYLPPHRKPSQGNQKQKQKQISKDNNDQVMIRPRFDPIPISYMHLLPIMIHVGEIVSKEIKPARFPYHLRHDPNATCRYHAGYIGHSIKACLIFKYKVQELLDQKLLYFTEKFRQSSTFVIAEALFETGHEYEGSPFHV